MFDLFTLRESEFYAWQASRLGDSERMDDVLAGLLWAIARLADDFPLVPGTDKLRVAESTQFLHDDGTPLRVRIWFVVAPANQAFICRRKRSLLPPIPDLFEAQSMAE